MMAIISMGATATQANQAIQENPNPAKCPCVIWKKRTVPPVVGNVLAKMAKVLATTIIKIPPIIQAMIAPGPAIFAQAKGLNNQPDPIIPATADANNVMVLT